jgi:hypothetical protein
MAPSVGTASFAARCESTSSNRGTGSSRRRCSPPSGQSPPLAVTSTPSRSASPRRRVADIRGDRSARTTTRRRWRAAALRRWWRGRPGRPARLATASPLGPRRALSSRTPASPAFSPLPRLSALEESSSLQGFSTRMPHQVAAEDGEQSTTGYAIHRSIPLRPASQRTPTRPGRRTPRRRSLARSRQELPRGIGTVPSSPWGPGPPPRRRTRRPRARRSGARRVRCRGRGRRPELRGPEALGGSSPLTS